MIEEFVDEEFPDFDEIESFFHEIEKNVILIYASLKDDFSIVYYPPYYEEGAISKDYYLLRLGKSYIRLYNRCLLFKSPKTNGWVNFDLRVRLGSLIDIDYSPFNLELPDDEWDNGKLNFDNVIPEEDLIINVYMDKIKNTFNKYEVLRLFL